MCTEYSGVEANAALQSFDAGPKIKEEVPTKQNYGKAANVGAGPQCLDRILTQEALDFVGDT